MLASIRGALQQARGRFLDSARWGRRDRHTGHWRLDVSLERATVVYGAAVMATGLASSLAAALGIFRLVGPGLLVAWVCLAGGLVWLAYRRRLRVVGDKIDAVAVGISIAAALSAAFLHHHYYASQADIGFYTTMAAVIARTGGLVLGGPFDAVLPGFAPAAGGAQVSALFGYPALASLFVLIGGPFAAPLVNGPLTLASSLFLYLVARRLGARIGGLVALLLWHGSFLTLWMGRWLMTENGAIASFWLAVLLTLALWRAWDPWRAAALLLALAYGALCRPEGVLVAAWTVLLVAARYAPRLAALISSSAGSSSGRRRLLVPALAALGGSLLFAGLLVGKLPSSYLEASREMAANVLRLRPTADSGDVPTDGPGPNWGDYALRYEWESVAAYGLPWILVVGIAGILLRTVPWRTALLAATLVAPYLLFVLMPPVTTAHPWFLRRLWVAIIPFVFLLAGVAADPSRVRKLASRSFGTHAAPRAAVMLTFVLVVTPMVGSTWADSVSFVPRREQDSVRPTVEFLLPRIPAGAALIVDEDVAEHASMLRLELGENVVAWFNQRGESFEFSFGAVERAERAFVLRSLNSAFPHVIGSGPEGGAVVAAQYDAMVSSAERRDFRQYLATPPLREGYEPLSQYLATSVPPSAWRQASKTVQLVELQRPFVIHRNCYFDAGHWERTPQGLLATAEYSAVVFNVSRIRPHILATGTLALHVAHVQLHPGSVTAYGYQDDGTIRPLSPTLDSDGSGDLRFVRVALPSPMDLRAVLFPAGTVLRGALFDFS